MPRQAYVNGRYLPHRQASVHIEDRGFQFADGIYEVVVIYRGTLIDEDPHLDRLERSLDELRIVMPMPRQALKLVARELIRRNDVQDGFIYLQITRGVAPREALLTSSTSYVLPVTRIDDTPVGDARPGPLTAALRRHYVDYIAGQGAAHRGRST